MTLQTQTAVFNANAQASHMIPAAAQPAIQLEYFDLSSRGLAARLLFTLADIKFEDVRVSFQDWPARKPSTPLGFLPVLHIDGNEYSQSRAINNYAARIGNLIPADPVHALISDIALDTVTEAFDIYTPDAEVNKTLFNKDSKLTKYYTYIDNLIAKSGSGFVSPSGITAADLALYGNIQFATSGFFPEVTLKNIAPFKNILSTLEKVATHPKLKSYFEKHPAEQLVHQALAEEDSVSLRI